MTLAPNGELAAGLGQIVPLGVNMRFFRSENGNTAIEYAILLGTIAAGLVLAMSALQSALGTNLNNSTTQVIEAGTAPTDRG
jgi:Flp pilus assembly pilin Flp